eukprot:466275_1
MSYVSLLNLVLILTMTHSIKYDEYQATNCSNSTFPVDMSNMQCFGLNNAPQAKSLQECQQSCCDSSTCSIYEWCPSQSTGCSPTSSCWIGVLSNNCVTKNGWVARAKAKTTNYTINTNTDGIGPPYGGLGGLSGGGATSRLLWDYDSKYQSQILDYLFKPYFGASLHILKTEIGGDTFSGCGTESSHMHDATSLNYNQGYEWYMMTEAKKRNPFIKGYGLPWGMPAWIGSGALNDNMTLYINNWILGAENVYNFTIDYIGIWNEDSWSTDYVKNLRKRLDSNNLQHVKIVVADNALGSGNTIAQQIQNDNAFAAAVDIIGIHYPSGSTSTTDMINSGKILWASEDDSSDDTIVGGGCLARIINWNYVIGSYTSTIIWNLLTAYYKYLRWYGDSFMTSSYPYSNFYSVNSPVWIAAHTTQFTYPLNEWNLLKHNNGAGMLEFGGTYVSYYNKQTKHISIVIETMNKNNSLCIRSNPSGNWIVTIQNITFQFNDSSNNNWANKKIYVWKSVLFSNNNNNISFFIQQDPIMIDENGKLNLFNVEPDSVITLTTTTGQQKGLYPPPPDNHPFPIPYFDDFSTTIINKTGKYFSDMCGSFAVEPCLDGKSGNCLTQQVKSSPSIANTGWHNQDSKQPLTIIGDYTLSNYEIYVECLFNGNGIHGKATNIGIGINLGGPLSKTGCGGNVREQPCVAAYNKNWYNFGYFFEFYIDGSWQLLEGINVINDGNYTIVKNNQVFSLTFGNKNGTLYGKINNNTIFNTISKQSYNNGWPGLGCGWFDCQFVKFQIQSVK